MSDRLPVLIPPSSGAVSAETPLVPALIADVGEAASWRYIEFFTANIRNPNTRRAYARACGRFFAWCENRHITLSEIRPFEVAAYVEGLQDTAAAAERQAGARRDSHAVRLADRWPDHADQSGLLGARTDACRKPARRRCSTALNGDAARRYTNRNSARYARPGADRDADLQLRAHHDAP